MMNASSATWLRKAAFVLLVIYGCLCMLAGFSDIIRPLIGHREPLTFLVGLIAALIGAGTLMRLRVAAVLLALLLAATGVKAIYSITHGLPLTNSRPLSPIEITCSLIFTFLPIVLTVVSWKRLKWLPKSSNQALEPTPDRPEN